MRKDPTLIFFVDMIKAGTFWLYQVMFKYSQYLLSLEQEQHFRHVFYKKHDLSVIIRGNYLNAFEKFLSVIPVGNLLIIYTKYLLKSLVLVSICPFLKIIVSESDPNVHKGGPAKVNPERVGPTIRFLKEQYDWVAANVGPLPQKWQDNLARVQA